MSPWRRILSETRRYDGTPTDIEIRVARRPNTDEPFLVVDLDQGVEEAVSLWLTKAEVEELVSWLQTGIKELSQ